MNDIRAMLEEIFSADTSIYRQRGFQRRVGFGMRPALVHIDLANAWTRPGNAVHAATGWTRSSPPCRR